MKINFILILFILALIFMYSINVEEDKNKSKNMELVLDIIVIFMIFNIIYDYFYLREQFANTDLDLPDGTDYYHHIVASNTDNSTKLQKAKSHFDNLIGTTTNKFRLKTVINDDTYYVKTIDREECRFSDQTHLCTNNLILVKKDEQFEENLEADYKLKIGCEDENLQNCINAQTPPNFNQFNFHIMKNNSHDFSFMGVNQLPSNNTFTYSSIFQLNTWLNDILQNENTFASLCGDTNRGFDAKIYVKFVIENNSNGDDDALVGGVSSNNIPKFKLIFRLSGNKSRDFVLGISEQDCSSDEDASDATLSASQKLCCRDNKMILLKEITKPDEDVGINITPLIFSLELDN